MLQRIKIIISIMFSIFLISGCSLMDKSEESNMRNKGLAFKGNYELYGKLSRKNDLWGFSDICYKYNDVEFNKNYNVELNKKFENISPITIFPQCNIGELKNKEKAIYKVPNSRKRQVAAEHVGYINLSTLRPGINTRSFYCNGMLFQGTSCNVNLPEFWESDIRESSLLSWLLVIPAIVGNYWADLYFDTDKYEDAVYAALSNKSILSLNSKHEKFIVEYKSYETRFRKDLSSYISRFEYEEEQELIIKENKRVARIKSEERRKSRELKKRNRELQERNRIKESFYSGISGKSIGDEVCTKYNKFGYLERIVGNKIQIRLKGIANSSEEYLLFSGSRFNYNVKEEMVWDKSDKWAKCDIAGL